MDRPPFPRLLVKQHHIWLTSRNRGGRTFAGDPFFFIPNMCFAITPEIHLSAITVADSADITEHLQYHEVSRYTLLIPYPYTLEMAHDWIACIADDVQRNGRETIWAIRESAGRMIGAIELQAGSAGKQHVSEIGYWLAKPFWGRGIMTAVVK